ncbi:hypothetical protein QPD78_04360 [Clostridioides difficile]|nr:hypothetical protein [Clostridioides difficile]MCJ0297935.1 hypothetical protein [Clostridioides difficile]MCJ0443864.1 hypothetical protein [Clostridioides difficile]MCJ0448446.1 hypothetical protein [Clostridioides difficile]MDK3263807.1 hypothetical protein [Clostridioides difficile]
MGAKNKVIAGNYKGCKVTSMLGVTSITLGPSITKTTVEAYELVTDEHRKSAKSGIARGIVGGTLLGPVGMLAGGLSAKNKGIYTIAIKFKDGNECLIEVDDKIYKNVIKSCF